MPESRRSASCSPSTASPRRLRLSRLPPSRSFAMAGPSFAGVASSTRWPTMARSTRRAIGMTTQGSIGAKTPPTRMAAFRYQGRNFGVSFATCSRLRPATPRSSGRMTPSTKPTVKARPFGSFSTPASRSAAGSTGCAALSASQRRTRETTSSVRGLPVAALRFVMVTTVLSFTGSGAGGTPGIDSSVRPAVHSVQRMIPMDTVHDFRMIVSAFSTCPTFMKVGQVEAVEQRGGMPRCSTYAACACSWS